MANDLTLKQRSWLKLYLELGNATEAAIRVYDTNDRNSAAQIGWENLRKLDYQDFLEEAGITDNLLQKKIIEGLDAQRVIGAMKGSTATSADADFIEVPDFQVRHKYLETALKLKKRLVDRQEITGKDGEPIQYRIITGTGFIPTGVVIDATPEANTLTGQSSIQDRSVAPEST
jgi:hypothetical protein